MLNTFVWHWKQMATVFWFHVLLGQQWSLRKYSGQHVKTPEAAV